MNELTRRLLVICHLRELVAALDRRRPQPARAAESSITGDAEVLRAEAVKRIAQLE